MVCEPMSEEEERLLLQGRAWRQASPEALRAIQYLCDRRNRRRMVDHLCEVVYEKVRGQPGVEGNVTLGKVLQELGPAAEFFDGCGRTLQRDIDSWYARKKLAKWSPSQDFRKVK